MPVDEATLADLARFARLEIDARDIEPWALVIDATPLEIEQRLWLVKLYNAFDDLGSAWRTFIQFPSPGEWRHAGQRRLVAADYSCSQERRSLRGGRVIRHLDSYVDHLGGQAQSAWLGQRLRDGAEPSATLLIGAMREIWGVGRQTAFEWAEFVTKTTYMYVDVEHGYLWESSGPRESIERLYGGLRLSAPSPQWLDQRAVECKARLADAGAPLAWWDFETVICDFNVMRKGRYYPGQHLAMIREEIEGLGEDSYTLAEALRRVVPERWAGVPAGVDKALRRVYRDTGEIRTPIGVNDVDQPA